MQQSRRYDHSIQPVSQHPREPRGDLGHAVWLWKERRLEQQARLRDHRLLRKTFRRGREGTFESAGDLVLRAQRVAKVACMLALLNPVLLAMPQEKIHRGLSIFDARARLDLDLAAQHFSRQSRQLTTITRKSRKVLRVAHIVGRKIKPMEHPLLLNQCVSDDNTALVEDRLDSSQDVRVHLCAMLGLHVFARDAQTLIARRQALLDPFRVVYECIVDDISVAVDYADAADAVLAPADFVEELHAFAFDGNGGAGGDEVEARGELRGAACVSFARGGKDVDDGDGSEFHVGRGDGRATFDPGDLVGRDCFDTERHGGWLLVRWGERFVAVSVTGIGFVGKGMRCRRMDACLMMIMPCWMRMLDEGV